ncbi:competence protein CoiA family protein [Streptomyces luteogriseus]|uniref:competence protein CoiA family protein n=1 Tax=Streptomyces luteogriseus TaxID=68233 RepID=UPI0036C584DF
MANGVWHTGYGIEINLSLPDLGHPGRPELLGEITARVTDRDPQLLECLAHHEGRECQSETGGKSPWMFIRRGRVGGRRPLVASHLPVTHKPTPAESAQHKATKERVVETAARYGLDSETEVPVADRRSVTDAVVTGPSGIRIGWEIQYHHISPSSVHRRSVNAVENGITPLWVAKDRTASLIDRAPWARVDDMPWKDIADGKEMVVRGGYRHLQVWKCVPSSDRHCLVSEGAGHCGAIHADWFVPALCVPEKKPVYIEDLVLQSATGESVPVYVPSRGNGRAGLHMWVPADERMQWEEIVGERTPLPSASVKEDDDVITFAEQEIDRSCRAGEEGWFVSDARPLRDLGQPTGGFTLPRMPVQGSRDPMRITPVERAAASAALGCPMWELGPCAGCGQLMRRYGRYAAMYCRVCRSVLNGRQRL